MLSAMAPPSRRAISNSELKVLMSSSASSMVLTEPIAVVPAPSLLRNAASARLRSRLSGVFKSWAMLSDTSRNAPISSSMRDQHGIEALRQAVEFVARTVERNAARQITRHDGPRRCR